jgi:hypothetical protein
MSSVGHVPRTLFRDVHLILKVRPVFQNILRQSVFLRGFLAVYRVYCVVLVMFVSDQPLRM